MSLVREYIIFEKFIENSDPIKDMDIGITKLLRELNKKTTNELSEYFFGTTKYSTECWFIKIILNELIKGEPENYQKIFKKIIKSFTTKKESIYTSGVKNDSNKRYFTSLDIDKIVEAINRLGFEIKNKFRDFKYYSLI
jgi:hypothetical protein